MKFYVTIKNRIATLTSIDGGDTGVGGNLFDEVIFTFEDREFGDIDPKMAMFVWNGRYHLVEFDGNNCEIPEITDANSVRVGVYIGDGDDSPKYASTSVELPYQNSIRDYAKAAHPFTGENYTELARKYAEQAQLVVEDAAGEIRKELSKEYNDAMTAAQNLEWALDALDKLVGGRP